MVCSVIIYQERGSISMGWVTVVALTSLSLNVNRYSADLHENGKPASEIIYSNVKALLEHQQYILHIPWNKSVPAEEKMREIKEGIVSANLEIFKPT
jgi:hypothetical protein